MAALPPDTQSGDSESEEDTCEYGREELISSNPFTLPNFSKRKIRYMALFDVEHWATDLKDFTFPTVVAEVEWGEALAVQHSYQEGICMHRNKFTDDDEQALASLRCKIDSLLSQLRGSNDRSTGFFVRLGPRSPKDAPMMVSKPPQDMPSCRASLCGFSEDKLRKSLEVAAQALELEGEKGIEMDACEILRCFNGVCYGLLRVTSAEEALRLLVSSSRVMQDVSHTLDQGVAGWNLSVVAREWDDEVKLEREFRAFVVAGEVTAVSQYDDQLTYRFVVENSEKIVAAIVNCLALTRPQLQRLSANLGVVVDFLVVPSGHDATPWQARIIELNPFGSVANRPPFGK